MKTKQQTTTRERMGWIGETMMDSIKSVKIRQSASHAVSLGVVNVAAQVSGGARTENPGRPSSRAAPGFSSSANKNTQRIVVTSALMMWKTLICITGSTAPIVVVLSESMEPGFQRGDILFLHMGKGPIRAGEIVVFNVDGRDIPIVHRVIKVHEQKDNGEVDVLTKGDKNPRDDRGLYAPGQLWLRQDHIMGRAVGFVPYFGWATIIMNDKPVVKYVLIGAVALLVMMTTD